MEEGACWQGHCTQNTCSWFGSELEESSGAQVGNVQSGGWNPWVAKGPFLGSGSGLRPVLSFHPHGSQNLQV
jgi:hypothetical protein